MTTYNTGNPLGSSDPRDLFDNAKNLDSFVNGEALEYNDRLGNARRSWLSMETDFETALLSYQAQVNDIVIAGGQIFESEAAGRVAVEDGQYFYAVSDNPDVSKTLWKRISATESERIADDPSVELFRNSLDKNSDDTLFELNISAGHSDTDPGAARI